VTGPPPMKRTGALDLLVPLVVIGVATFVLLKVSYESIPPLGYFVPVPLAVLAVAEFVAARRVRAAVRHEPYAKPMTAIVIARCVALGKASSIVGAGVAGAAVALLFRVVPDADVVRTASNDTKVGVLLLGSTILVVAAGLLLERAGIDPNRDRRDRPNQPA
jgi:Protein of unknown function (DUF3180)